MAEMPPSLIQRWMRLPTNGTTLYTYAPTRVDLTQNSGTMWPDADLGWWSNATRSRTKSKA